MNISLKTISQIFIVIFIYFLIISFITGFFSLPNEGDSVHYHIPIAKNILNGNFLFQKNIVAIEQWYPGSTEIILALFIFLHIPLNLYNILSVAFFSVVLFKLGSIFLKDKYFSLIFSISISSLYGIFRLAHTQNVDVWMGIYFLLLIILLESPTKTLGYFLKLGIISGFLIGSKYTGSILFLIISVVYIKSILKYLNIKRVIIFLVPFSIFGLFWYMRNLVLTGSPFYPQSILFFHGLANWKSYLALPMWKAFLGTPLQVVNAYISEFMIWPVLFLTIPAFVLAFKKYKTKFQNYQKLKRLLIISLLYFLVYLFLPYDNKYLGLVLSMRYTFALLALVSVCVFMIFEALKLEAILSILLLANTFVLFLPVYHPKLIFIYEPIVLLVLIFLYRKKIIFKFRKFPKNN